MCEKYNQWNQEEKDFQRGQYVQQENEIPPLKLGLDSYIQHNPNSKCDRENEFSSSVDNQIFDS